MSEKNGVPTGKHTLVEEGTEFKGTMSSRCPIVVMGKVEGDVAGPEIHVSPTGVIAGNVKVKELRSEGEVAGEVEAETVRISGKVRDRTVIRARTLEVSLAAEKGGMQIVFGECELAVGDEPNKEAAIAAATAQPAAAQPAATQPAATPATTAPPAAEPPAAEAQAADAQAASAPAETKKGGRRGEKAEAAAQGDEEGSTSPRRRGTQPPPV
jgi:cytoskeletal protein CcmA (bactofilin family)